MNEFSFSVYGPDFADIERISESKLPHHLIHNLLLSQAQKDESNKLNTYQHQGEPNAGYKTYDNKGGYGYIYFNN